jgi:hypothetical protein
MVRDVERLTKQSKEHRNKRRYRIDLRQMVGFGKGIKRLRIRVRLQQDIYT